MLTRKYIKKENKRSYIKFRVDIYQKAEHEKWWKQIQSHTKD